MFRSFAFALILLTAASTPAVALSVGEQVEDFSLLDEQGRYHSLRYYGDARALVLFVQGNGCGISRSAVPALRTLREQFEPRGVVFLGLNANPQDDRASVAAEAREWNFPFPVLRDETQRGT